MHAVAGVLGGFIVILFSGEWLLCVMAVYAIAVMHMHATKNSKI